MRLVHHHANQPINWVQHNTRTWESGDTVVSCSVGWLVEVGVGTASGLEGQLSASQGLAALNDIACKIIIIITARITVQYIVLTNSNNLLRILIKGHPLRHASLNTKDKYWKL